MRAGTQESNMSATPQRNLQGQKALVTGSTSGLGRAIACNSPAMAPRSSSTAATRHEARQTVEMIRANGGSARFVAADLSDPAAIERLAEETGEIDILVNNAGFSTWGPTADLDVATFDAMFAANVRAPFYLVAAFAPRMAARGNGSIINIGSMAGSLGLAGERPYGATKAALTSLAQGWAAEFSPHGVRVNTVAAGPIYTRPEAASSSIRSGPPPR